MSEHAIPPSVPSLQDLLPVYRDGLLLDTLPLSVRG